MARLHLSVVLGLLFITSWVGQFITQWFTWGERAAGHNQPLQVGAFLWQFWESILENCQSEFLQLFSFVSLSALFIHRGQRRVQGQRRADATEPEPNRAAEGPGGGQRRGAKR